MRELAKFVLAFAKVVLGYCVAFSWFVIHLHTIGYMVELDVSSDASQAGVFIMSVSAFSLPVYLVYRVCKSFKKSTREVEK